MGNSKELTFDDFKKLASDKSLSNHEKIGFPDSYREGYENFIFEDILSKLPFNKEKNSVILDIGCGCSGLVNNFIEECEKNDHTLILIDSEEMLSHIPDKKNVIKFPGYYPDIPELFKKFEGKIDYAVAYSVFHYIFNEGNTFDFIHKTIDLLKPGGSFLVGDLPNISKRDRFLNSKEGEIFLSKANQSNALKGATNHNNTSNKIDDSIVMSMLTRFRNFQCETYLLPQSKSLPLANRREDILITKR